MKGDAKLKYSKNSASLRRCAESRNCFDFWLDAMKYIGGCLMLIFAMLHAADIIHEARRLPMYSERWYADFWIAVIVSSLVLTAFNMAFVCVAASVGRVVTRSKLRGSREIGVAIGVLCSLTVTYITTPGFFHVILIMSE